MKGTVERMVGYVVLACLACGSLSALADVHYLIDFNGEFPVVLAELDASDSRVSTYTYGADPVPLSRLDIVTGEKHYYHYDANFNLTAISDESGQVVATYSYDSFGNLVRREGVELRNDPTIFAGHNFDEKVDLYYMRDRYYDAHTGRFNQQDSFQGSQGVPASLHKYAYGHNDPVNNRDPSGKFISGLSAGQNIAGVLTLATAATYTSIQSGMTGGYAGSNRDSGGLASSSILLMGAVRNGLNEIIYFNTKHTKNVIAGLLQDAEEHADKIGSSPPEDPNKSHWKKEVRAFLRKARRLADKRLKGNTRVSTLKKIDEIASRAGVRL